MPSTYTVNLGIEKPATGEQSGTWGDTTNVNFDILDQAINGAVRVTLTSAGSSGSPNALQITNGATSDGRNKWVEFYSSGDLGGSAYVQLDPNDAEKIVFVRNSLASSRSVILFQGTYNSARDLEVPAGVDMVVKFDGGGASAATVTDVYTKLRVTELTTPTLTATTADINGGTLDNSVIGGTTAAAITGTTIVANTSLNIAGDGATVTGIKDEDNMASNSATKLATQQSIKAYVDSQVGTVDTLAEILANGNTSGSNNLIINNGQALTSNTINETTAGSGVTIDSVLLKDDVVNATDVETSNISANDGTQVATLANSTGVITVASSVLTTTDINGGTIDNTNIGASTPGTGAFTSLNSTNSLVITSSVPRVTLNDSDGTNTQGDIRQVSDAIVIKSRNGSSNGAIKFTGENGSTEVEYAKFDANGLFISKLGAVFNEDSANVDFRVESDSNANMLFVDAGNNRVGIGMTPATDFHIKGVTTIDGDGSSRAEITSSTASSIVSLNVGGFDGTPSVARDVRFFVNAASNAKTEAMRLESNQDAAFLGNLTIPEKITHTGDADTFLQFNAADSFRVVTGDEERLKANNGEVVVNDNSADMDFRVESNGNANMLFVDGGNNRVGIGVGAPSDVLQVHSGAAGRSIFRHASGDGGVTITGTGAGSAASLIFGNNWDNDSGSNFVEEYRLFMDGADDSLKFNYNANASTALTLSSAGAATFGSTLTIGGNFLAESSATINSTIRATGNNTRAIANYQAHDSSGNDVNMVMGVFGDATRGEISTNTNHTLRLYVNNTPSKYLEIATTGQIFTSHGMVVNEDSNDSDFRVESNSNTHMLFVDAGNESVGIATSATGATGSLVIKANSGAGAISIIGRNNGGIGTISFYDDDGSSNVGYIQGRADDNQFRLWTTTSDILSLGQNNTQRLHFTDNEAILNSNSGSYKFYITRTGSTNQSGSMYADDNTFVFDSTQDEVSGANFLFRGTNDAASNVSYLELDYAGGTTFNQGGLAQQDFRVESDNESNMLFVDASANFVAFGNNVANPASGFASQGGAAYTDTGGFQIANSSSGASLVLGQNFATNGSICDFRKQSVVVGSISVTGSATSYNTSSDARLKENIADADDAGVLIDAIQVRQFDWIADGEHQRYGMVAQELNTVAPEAVSEGETEEDMMAVDYSKLVPMLVKEIQSLRARVAQIENT